MKTFMPALLALAIVAPAQAAKIAMEDQSQVQPSPAKPATEAWFQPPQEQDLPADAFGQLVQEGRAIFV
ncbi:MAG: cytochrome C, partial [Pseudomonas sagittaria]|nr:cytochrome C [Pseudomonas sagittaria]